MTKLTPTYLHYRDPSSNKFYIVCPLPDGKHALTGWGWNATGTAGQWKKLTLAEARTKESEKLRKGYRSVPYSSLPNAALNKLVDKIKDAALTQAVSMNADGTVSVGGSAGTSTGTVPQAPRRPKGNKAKIYIWI